MNVYCLVLLVGAALKTSEAAILNTNPVNGSILYKCSGSDVILPWIYSLSPGDVVANIKWFFNDRLEAQYTHNIFLASQEFLGHIEHIKNVNLKTSQLMIKKVTNYDSGDYTIQINGRSANHSRFTLQRTLTLFVTDNLSDHQLQLKSTLVWNKAMRRMSVELLCGKFQFQTPLFDVQWLTPSRQVMNSTGYRDGFFYQYLSVPIEPGEYTCRLSNQTANACTSKDLAATVTVESRDRMTELEVQQDEIQKQQHFHYQSINQQQQDQMRTMNQSLQEEKNKFLQLQDQMQSMNQQLQNQIKAQVQDQMKVIKQDLLDKHNVHVSFSARWDGNGSGTPSHDPMRLGLVEHNHGGAYNRTDGVFTTPFQGLYFFAAGSGTCSGSTGLSGMSLMKDGKSVSYTQAGDHGIHELHTINRVVLLKEGERVWLKAAHPKSCYDFPFFSGFLVSQG